MQVKQNFDVFIIKNIEKYKKNANNVNGVTTKSTRERFFVNLRIYLLDVI